MMARIALLVSLLIGLCHSVHAQIGELDDVFLEIRGDQFWIANRSAESYMMSGLGLNSKSGQLIPDPNEEVAPFLGGFYVANTRNQITIGLLGASKYVELAPESAVATPVRLRNLIPDDLFAFLGLRTQQISIPVVLGDAPLHFGLATEIRGEDIWLVNTSVVETTAESVRFRSAAGRILPIPSGGSAAPFQTIETNTPSDVVLSSLGSRISFAPQAAVATSVGFHLQGKSNELMAYAKSGGVETPLNVKSLAKTRQIELKADIRDQSVWLTNTSDSASPFVSQVDFESPGGFLLPVQANTQGGLSAAPFHRVGENTTHKVTLSANVGDNIVLAPKSTVQTAVGYDMSGPVGDLKGTMTYSRSGPIALSIQDHRPPGFLSGELVMRVRGEEGTVWITNDAGRSQYLSGLELQSPSRALVPIPAGQTGGGPFDVLTTNTPQLIRWDSPLGKRIEIADQAEIETSARYSVPGLIDINAVTFPDQIALRVFDERPIIPFRPAIAIEQREGGDIWIVNQSSSPLQLLGMELSSASGQLIPSPTIVEGNQTVTGTAPFQVLIHNSPTSIVFGNIGRDNTITLAPGESLRTDARFQGSILGSDLKLAVGNANQIWYAVQYQITPEPSSMALASILLLMGHAFGRRRRIRDSKRW